MGTQRRRRKRRGSTLSGYGKGARMGEGVDLPYPSSP